MTKVILRFNIKLYEDTINNRFYKIIKIYSKSVKKYH